jgi:hypothetical protein
MKTFLRSSSSVVGQEAGFSLGWLALVLLAAGIIFATAEPAAADQCAGLSDGQCHWVAEGNCCNNNTYQNEVYYCKISGQCLAMNNRCNTLSCGM